MKILLLAGTREGRDLAAALADWPGMEVTASLAGATRDPITLPVPTRSGGFGGEGAQRKFIQDNGIEAIVDATHPFAAQITARSHKLAQELGLPYLQLLRSGWTAGDGDAWTFIADEAEAARHIPLGATVFLATGRQTLHRFANLQGRHVICRQIERSEGDFPFAGGEYLIGHPPFSVEDEVALFRARKVDVLVVKNAGGTLSRTKLDAARLLGLPVLLIRRPAQPEAPRVETVAGALDWLRALQGAA